MATEAQDPGMPQLDFGTFPNQVFWLFVTLVAIYFILSRLALPRIGGILSGRQGTIARDLAAAEDFRARAREAEAAYGKALADAGSEALRIAARSRAGMKEELAAAVVRADGEIAKRVAESERAIAEIRAGSRAAIREVARDVAVGIVEKMGVDAESAVVDTALARRMGA